MHHKSNTARALVFAILSILFSGCTLTTFEHPIESLDEANVPTELFGLYHGVSAKAYAVCTLLVEPAGEGTPRGLFRYTMEEQPLNVPEKQTRRGFCMATRFESSYVIQVPIFNPEGNAADKPTIEREMWGNPKILQYIFLRVRLEADEMELALLDSTFVERAIDQGKVQGLVKRSASVVPNRVEKKTTDSQPEITPEPKVESITVTAESDALRTFIRENLDQGLFSAKDNPRYTRAK
jgi:hypothetical protein